MRTFLLLLISLSFVSARGYQPFLSFSASASGMSKIHSKHKVLPLSGKPYYFSRGDCSVEGLVDFDKTVEKVRWRQLLPESLIGKGMPCMTQRLCKSTLSNRMYSGPGCCRKSSVMFKKMSSDLHNIIPTVLKEGVEDLMHSKEIKDKGLIARIYLYMMKQYQFKVNDSLKHKCLKWHKKYPVSLWEKEKNREIFKVQGTFNPYIEKL